MYELGKPNIREAGLACGIHKDVLLYEHHENWERRTVGITDLLQVSVDHPARMEIIQALSDPGQLRL